MSTCGQNGISFIFSWLRFFVRDFATNPLRRAVGLDATYGPGPVSGSAPLGPAEAQTERGDRHRGGLALTTIQTALPDQPDRPLRAKPPFANHAANACSEPGVTDAALEFNVTEVLQADSGGIFNTVS